ncbi:hydroxymethylglutaryl-CoA reductase, degradative [Streptococcus sp. NLN64]|uniref:hydroxymethylglutaryl-CoA reductase, degradative n=1 Tax=Streptococcus sp. NLN64 TaxID=2822799 RepID=UPI0018C95C66|nr:hydroxymethylglutaryl-CoA reductase, degradative [Streptococcus sp. NLN64]
MSMFSGFYKQSRQDRIALLHKERSLTEENIATLVEDANLPEAIAGKMVENHLGTFSLPYAVLPEILVNGHNYTVPMVTEEPSVVAAASFGAKIISRSGGFETSSHKRQMIGQVALFEVENVEKAKEAIQNEEEKLLQMANQAYSSIVKRGGGARQLTVEVKEPFLIVYLHVDVQEAMGANILNTMLEALKEPLEFISQGQALMGILSNYATDSLVTSRCQIPIAKLSMKKAEAVQIADKIALASLLAQVDPYRAATHNKGIFNGIDAVVVATGNDWRAIEAGAHAYASRDGVYRGLSTWTIDGDNLVGEMTIPLPVATVGGSIGLNPKVAASFNLLGEVTAKELAAIIASVGLCQNFAALKALVTTGIQSGHMKLQLQSLALHAGARVEEVAELVTVLRKSSHPNLQLAKEVLKDMRNQ